MAIHTTAGLNSRTASQAPSDRDSIRVNGSMHTRLPAIVWSPCGVKAAITKPDRIASAGMTRPATKEAELMGIVAMRNGHRK